MIVGTAGHIDHGKTALIRALTGVDTARHKEERARGITIDLGFAYKPLPDGHILGFVDVPGHERFVHNMLAGACGIDFALLVVAADDGPMPQTREHAAILHLLGLSQGMVALTKTDLVESVQLAAVEARIHALIAGTALAGYPLFRVSARTGQGIAELAAELEARATNLAPPAAQGQFRLAVDRSFSLTGAGTVVTGTVFSGRVAVGDRLLVSPCAREVRVRAIHAQNRAAQEGCSGQRCALNLVGPQLGRADIVRGDWIVAPAAHAPTARFDAELWLLRDEQRALQHWTPVHVHLGAAFVPAHVAVLDGTALAPGASGLVQLVLDRPIGALHGDRFVLRDQSAQRTLGGGRVIDPFAPVRNRRTPARMAALHALRARSAREALDGLLAACPEGVDLDAFALAHNLRASEAEALFEASLPAPVVVAGRPFGFRRERHAALRAMIIAAVERHHAARPDLAGATLQQIRMACVENLPLALVHVLADLEVAAGAIVRAGALFRLPVHRPAAGTGQPLQAVLLSLLRDADCRPPRVRELALRAKANEKLVRSVLQVLTGESLVYRVSEDYYFSRDAVWKLALRTQQLLTGLPAGVTSIKALRDGLGIGRNLLIELLEFFDSKGFTARVGDGRRMRRDPRLSFGIDDATEAADRQ